jgi:hypothetical protein
MKRIFVGVALLLPLPACISYSTMQSADTLAPGQTSAYMGISGQALESAVKESAPNASSIGSQGMVFYEFGGRLGITEEADIGARIILEPGPPSYTADVKYQFVRGQMFSLSSGIGISYLGLSVPIADQNTNLALVDANIPLYMTYHVFKNLDLGLTPRAIFRATGDGGSYSMFGGTAGLYVGGRTRLALEASAFQHLQSKDIVKQATLGVIFSYPSAKRSNKRERSL